MDLTKCTGETDKDVCPIREKCLRYTAPENKSRQSYLRASECLKGDFLAFVPEGVK